MGIVIDFPAERRSTGTLFEGNGDGGSVIILPVIRVERHGETPSDSSNTSSPRGRRRKR